MCKAYEMPSGQRLGISFIIRDKKINVNSCNLEKSTMVIIHHLCRKTGSFVSL
jgi:hypothetical protein